MIFPELLTPARDFWWEQDSNFKLTGQQIDDDKIGRTSVKLHQPPGGKSSGLW